MLQFISTFVSETIPGHLYFPIIAIILLLATIYAYAQGRRTDRDRDLHARKIILTGAFTPLGLNLLEFLAKKGAHIIVLLPTPSLTSYQHEILNVLRITTSNEDIYAEPCPLDSLDAITKFCEQFANTENESARRIDALILAHEYNHIGLCCTGIGDPTRLQEKENRQRDERALATFQLITLLLPAMLVAPVDRDIRIINIVNPFYAAAAPKFDPRLASYSSLTQEQKRQTRKGSDDDRSQRGVRLTSIWSHEGQRALRTIIFTRHLQRILDALPEPGTVSDNNASSSIPKKNNQKSNIMAVTVCPGISRPDTIGPCILPPSSLQTISIVGRCSAALSYLLLLPFLYLFTKSPTSALQSVLHVLCVPKPITRQHVPITGEPSNSSQPSSRPAAAEEVLVPGALYADCAVVRIQGGINSAGTLTKVEPPGQSDPGLGDERLGQAVWEVLEDGINTWKRRSSADSTQSPKTKDDLSTDSR